MAVSLKISMLAAVSGAALVAFATPAVAAGEQFQERGRVVGVVDGDTVKVDLWGDGTSTPRLVRFTGIDTPEKSRCHGPAAHKRAKELALGRIVHLHSIDKNNMSGVRLRRTVLVAQGGGEFLNLPRTMVREGRAVWLPGPLEYAHNLEYHQLAEQARAKNTRIWDADACGQGPNQNSHLGMTVQWDAPGIDDANPNGEIVSIKNRNATVAISLAGWWVRDSTPKRYIFPAGTVLLPGATLRLHVGQGISTPLDQYWGASQSILSNATSDGTHMGEGAYLLDPDGDIRKAKVWPSL